MPASGDPEGAEASFKESPKDADRLEDGEGWAAFDVLLDDFFRQALNADSLPDHDDTLAALVKSLEHLYHRELDLADGMESDGDYYSGVLERRAEVEIDALTSWVVDFLDDRDDNPPGNSTIFDDDVDSELPAAGSSPVMAQNRFFKKAWKKIKDAARKVAEAAKRAARKAAEAARKAAAAAAKAAKKVAEEAAKAAKKAAEAVKKTANQVGKGAAKIGKQIGKGATKAFNGLLSV